MGEFMARVKTSIYVDGELWKRFKEYAFSKGLEVSSLLEDLMREEMAEDIVDKALSELIEFEVHELDFEPVETKEGVISELIRTMRNERENNLLR